MPEGRRRGRPSADRKRLRGAEKKSFWTSDKNGGLCTYLRDRYRGLDKSASTMGEARLRTMLARGLGRTNVETIVPTREERRAEFEFEAFVVDKAARAGNAARRGFVARGQQGADGLEARKRRRSPRRSPKTLRRLVPAGARARVPLANEAWTRHEAQRAQSSERATIEKVTSITDGLGGSQGSAGKSERTSNRIGAWSRIDELWAQGRLSGTRTALS